MTTTITFKADELRRLLANGILFAAPAKDCLPALEVVRFDWDGDHLFTVATNRYVLSWEEAEYCGDGNTEGRDPFSVGTPDAKRVISMLTALRSPQFPVSVEYDGESGKATFTIDGDTLIVSTFHERDFPQWRRLIPVDDAKADVDTITLGAKWLALFAKVKTDCGSSDGGGTPVRFQFNGDAKPVGVSIGEHFRAIVIPLKNAG